MQEFTKFATPVITIPEKMEGINKKGENVMVKTLTKKGNLKTLNGEKSIKVKADKNTKEVLISSVGEKIMRNTIKLSKKLQNEMDKLEGVIKERKPRKKKEVNEDKPKKERKPRKKKVVNEVKAE